ncbi:MAG: hypothetical protein IKU52_05425, partial [Clostridia bacterium]|nr:hypothetical protein [Clostridia bacterium]
MVNSKIYSRIGKLLSVIAVMIAVAVPLQVFVFAGFEKYAIPISLGVPFLFIGLGYLLQMVVSRIIGYAPVGYEGEGNIRLDYIDKKAIAFPILVCIAEGVGIYFLIVFLLDKFEVIYDPYNLYLYLIPVFLALFSAAGCVFWFIPYGKILPMEMLPVYFSVFAFTYVFSLFFKISSLFLSICVLIFFPLFMVVNNLQNIEQSIKHAKFRMPENGFRSYNFALTVK